MSCTRWWYSLVSSNKAGWNIPHFPFWNSHPSFWKSTFHFRPCLVYRSVVIIAQSFFGLRSSLLLHADHWRKGSSWMMNGFPFCKESFLFPVTFKKHIIKYYNQQSEKIGKESSHPHHYHPFGCQHTNPKAHWSSNGRSWNKQLLKSLKSPKTSIQNVPKFWLPIFRNQSINLHPTWVHVCFRTSFMGFFSSTFSRSPCSKASARPGQKTEFCLLGGPLPKTT